MDINYRTLLIFYILKILHDVRCDDPCNNYTLVNDTTRLTSYSKSSNDTEYCDNFEAGWYSFDATLTGAMPTECPSGYSQCGSDMQVWLNDTLPTEADGIAEKQSCVKVNSACCDLKRPLKMKNCTSYFVYFLVPSPVLCFRYCVQDIDECLSSPCKNGATCKDQLNAYTCTCVDGWNGTNCEHDIDECLSSPCRNGATCNNLLNAYTCTCVDGWNGNNCEHDTDECLSSPCRNGATCNNLLNAYSCTCVDGWNGTNCEHDIDECLSSPCKNGATCNNLLNAYTCTCVDGWNGTNCEYNIDECLSSPCRNGATCNNLLNAYTCTCVDGWDGTNCEHDIDECFSSPCKNGATCNNQLNEYTCTCVDGWNGTHCENDIDKCKSQPCKNGGTCNNQLNGYICTCADGWNGTQCDIDVDDCTSSPCLNGATCNDNFNNYTCSCPDGWTGINCEQDIKLNVPGATCGNKTNVLPCANGSNCEVVNGVPTCISSQKDDDSVIPETSLIIAISVGGSVVFLVGIFIAIYCIRERHRHKEERLLKRRNMELKGNITNLDACNGSDCSDAITTQFDLSPER